MNEFEWHLLEDRPPLTSVVIDGRPVRPGERIRLRPSARGDVLDMALAGKIAIIESIEQDYEGQIHLSVVLEDDPGRDIGMMRQPGHRFFFAASEVEPFGETPALQRVAEKPRTILLAGIGNIFMGDDAFGVEVAQRLANRIFPGGVRVVDFGIRGLDLAYALIDGPDVAILIDAFPRGGAAGDLYVVEPDLNSFGAEESSTAAMDAHSMNPMNVIRAAKAMGGKLNKILLLGCEPQTLGPDEGHMGLSDPVSVAVERAIPLIDSLVQRILSREWPLDVDRAPRRETTA